MSQTTSSPCFGSLTVQDSLSAQLDRPELRVGEHAESRTC